MSDSERKAAEEYADKQEQMDLEERAMCIDDFLAGRSSALKEIEQIAREAAMFGYNFARDNVVETNPVIEIHKFLGAINDYWQKKTESKEANEKKE